MLIAGTVETARTARHIQQGQDFGCGQRPWLYVILRLVNGRYVFGADLFLVPDLVFSEMKFLHKQRNDQESEAEPQIQAARKRRKKDPGHLRSEEISAFFTSRHSVPAEKSPDPVSISIQKREKTLGHANQPERKRVPRAQGNMSTTKMADKAKSSQTRSKNPRHDSTSYVTWSESSNMSRLHSVHSQRKHHVQTGQFDLQDNKGSTSTDRKNPSLRQSTPPVIIRQKTLGTVQRHRSSSVMSLQRRPSRSHSCPQRSSSLHRPNFGNGSNGVTKLPNARTGFSLPSLPACILVRPSRVAKQVQMTDGSGTSKSEAASPLGRSNLSHPWQPILAEEEKESVREDSQNSLDLWNVVQQCNAAIQDRYQSHESGESSMRVYATHSLDGLESKENFGLIPTAHGISRLCSAENEKCTPWVPGFAGPGIYEEQARRSQLPLEILSEENVSPSHQLSELEDVNIIDDLDYHDIIWNEQTGDLVLDEPKRRSRTYEVDNNHTEEHMAHQLGPRGFWRPNRLY